MLTLKRTHIYICDYSELLCNFHSNCKQNIKHKFIYAVKIFYSCSQIPDYSTKIKMETTRNWKLFNVECVHCIDWQRICGQYKLMTSMVEFAVKFMYAIYAMCSTGTISSLNSNPMASQQPHEPNTKNWSEFRINESECAHTLAEMKID